MGKKKGNCSKVKMVDWPAELENGKEKEIEKKNGLNQSRAFSPTFVIEAAGNCSEREKRLLYYYTLYRLCYGFYNIKAHRFR